MKILADTSIDPFTAQPKRSTRRRTTTPAPQPTTTTPTTTPAPQPTATTPTPAQPTVVPMPTAPEEGFEDDLKYRGMTLTMDKVLDALHRDGWSMARLYRAPLAVLPLPEGKFPPGRVYLFSENVAVVVNEKTGSVITSLPAHAALKTLNLHSPDVLAGDRWASRRWAEFLSTASADDVELTPRHHKQSWFDRSGATWTVKRVRDGARVYRDGVLLHTVADGDAAEDLDLHPVLVELVDFVVTEQ